MTYKISELLDRLKYAAKNFKQPEKLLSGEIYYPSEETKGFLHLKTTDDKDIMIAQEDYFAVIQALQDAQDEGDKLVGFNADEEQLKFYFYK